MDDPKTMNAALNMFAMFGNLGSSLHIRNDDTFVVSYPRSGNTWLRMIITHIISGGHPQGLSEMDACIPDIYKIGGIKLQELTSPRILKSHSRANRFYPSIIYCVRDPRAVCISYYNYQIRIGALGRHTPITLFVDKFLRSNTFPFVTWQEARARMASVKAQLRASRAIIKTENIVSFPRQHYPTNSDVPWNLIEEN